MACPNAATARPSLDPVVEHDFQRFMPAAASFHVARLDQSATSKPANDESLARMCDQAPERARPLADLGAELIMFCCTSGSFLRGFGWDRELARRIEEAVGVPALTTSSAVAEALAALGIRRAFMVTPYPRSANEREQAFFNAHGVEIPAFTSFECERSHDIDKVTPGAIAERVLAHRAAIDDCDGVFVSCTALARDPYLPPPRRYLRGCVSHRELGTDAQVRSRDPVPDGGRHHCFGRDAGGGRRGAAGVRQCDVMAELYRVTTDGTPEIGGTFTCKPPNAMAGEACRAPHLSWTDAPLAEHEMFFIEMGGCRHRYHAPLSRCVYVGKPTERMTRMW